MGQGHEREICFGDTPLHQAVRFGHTEVMQLLIARGANPEISNLDGRTPLHLAAERGHLAAVKLLLEAEVALEVHDTFGAAAIHLAAANGHTATVAVLLDKGADADQASGVTRAASNSP